MCPPTRRHVLSGLTALGVSTVAGCTEAEITTVSHEDPPTSLGTSWQPPSDEWWFPRQGIHNTGRSQTAGHGASVDWHAPSASPATTTQLAAVTQEQIISAAHEADVVTLAAWTPSGTQQWELQLSVPTEREWDPQFGGLLGDRLYLSDRESDLICIDTTDGTVVWRRNIFAAVAQEVPEDALRRPPRFSPLVKATPESLYLQSNYGVHGIDPSNGTEQWRIYLGDELGESTQLRYPRGLAITDDRVWVTYSGAVPRLLSIRSRDETTSISTTELPIEHPAEPVVTPTETVLIGTDVLWADSADRTLVAGSLAPTSGSPWQFPGLASTGETAFSKPAFDGSILFSCEAHWSRSEFVVFALRPADGGIEWLHRESLQTDSRSNTTGRVRVAEPAVVNETLLVGYGSETAAHSGNGTVVGLETTDGSVKFRTELPVIPSRIAGSTTGVYVGGLHDGIVSLSTRG